MPGCLRIFLYAVIAAIAAIGAVAFFASRPQIDYPDLSEINVSDYDRSELNVRLDEIDSEINQSKKTGVAIPIHLSISEVELASKIDAWAGKKFFTEFRDLRTHFREDTIVVVGTMRIGRFDFPFRNDIRLRIETGDRSLELIRVQVGDLFLPGPIRAALAALAERSVDAGFPRWKSKRCCFRRTRSSFRGQREVDLNLCPRSIT